jgi:Ca2+-binding RTX toxin-like protein
MNYSSLPRLRWSIAAISALVSLAAFGATAPSASGTHTVRFGVDLANVTPVSGAFSELDTVANTGGSVNVLPAGMTVPEAGVITQWRVKTGAATNFPVQFRVMRGHTSIYLGPAVTIDPAGVEIVSFPENVAVQAGDSIGLTRVTGNFAVPIWLNSNTSDVWFGTLGANETRSPEDPNAAVSLAIQADLAPPHPSAAPPDPKSLPAAATCRGLPATIVGTQGDDALNGTAKRDVVSLGVGNDTFTGGAGNDLICGGDGDDVVRGGAGKDNLFGEAGNDVLKGGKGADKCVGGPGADVAKKCEKVRTVP